MKNKLRHIFLIGAVVGVLLSVAFLVYASRRHEVVLFYYGAAAEVPGGTAFAVMNPFRDQTSEHTARRLIADLRTSNCQTILKQFGRQTDICTVLQSGRRATLVWRRDDESRRMLVYDIPEKQARLSISFSREEAGFVISSVSMVR